MSIFTNRATSPRVVFGGGSYQGNNLKKNSEFKSKAKDTPPLVRINL
ncbi:hypothetical protein N0Y54_03620 [Nostoc punctiforme UO1]